MDTLYKARFTAQATVTLEIEVRAPNQEAGLVLAHDAVGAANWQLAEITGVSPETIVNISFDRISPNPSSNDKAVVPMRLEFYADADCQGLRLLTMPCNAPLPDAERALNDALTETEGEPVLFGSGQVVNVSEGVSLYWRNAERGGWEVEAWATTEDCLQPLTRVSWLADYRIASVQAARLLGQYPTNTVIRIKDYTNRSAGSILVKEVG